MLIDETKVNAALCRRVHKVPTKSEIDLFWKGLLVGRAMEC